MNNKKVAFIILSLAIVASLLTMYRKSQEMEIAGEYGPMGSKVGVMGGYDSAIGMTAPAPMMIQEDVIGIGNRMPPTSISEPMMYPYYGDDALSEDMRVYDKSAYQGVVVSNVSEYMKQVKEYIQSGGGKILSSNQNTGDDMQYAYLMAKVPTEKFDDVTAMISAKAKKVVTESINTSDVTGQKVGMEDRTKLLLEQRAKKTAELDAAKTEADKKRIQAEIDRLDQQIMQQQKSQERFEEQVQYATISLTAADTERYFNPEKGGSIWDEVRRAWMSLGGTGKVLAYFLVWVGVYSVIWLPIILAARWLWMRMAPRK